MVRFKCRRFEHTLDEVGKNSCADGDVDGETDANIGPPVYLRNRLVVFADALHAVWSFLHRRLQLDSL